MLSVPLLFHTAPEGSPAEVVGGMKVVVTDAATSVHSVPDQTLSNFEEGSNNISPTERLVHPVATGAAAPTATGPALTNAPVEVRKKSPGLSLL